MTLYAHFPLDEENTSTAYDHTGNNYSGDITGATQGATGILTQSCYELNGSGDIVSVSNFPFGFFNSNGWSVSVWVNAETKNYGQIVRQRPDGSNNYSVEVDNDGNYRIQEPNGTITGPSVKVGEWKMLTAVYRKNDDYIFYVDGSEYKSSSLSTNLNGTSTLGIGGDAINNTNYWEGKIAEVRFYDRALTPSEVQYLHSVSQRGRQVSSGKSS